MASVNQIPERNLDVGHGAQNSLLAYAHRILTAATPFYSLLPPLAALANVPLCTREPWGRGMRIAASLLVSAVTYLIGAPVYWGILHLLGVCMLLYAAVRKRWEPLPGIYACGAALLIFALTFMLPIRVRVGVPFLFPFGLRTAAFASADYYPLLPWGALFFAAAAAGERLGDMPPEKKYASAPRALAWLSRRSLLIYLVHQPVLLALAALLQRAAQGA